MMPTDPHQQPQPSWLLAQPQPMPPQPPAGPPQMMSAARWLAIRHGARILPGVTTTTVLALARIWHEQGAAHNVGDAALMVALAVGAAAAGTVSATGQHGDAWVTATGYGAAASLTLTAVVAYTDQWPLAALMWLLATIATYALAAPHWRAAKARREDHAAAYALQHLQSQTQVAVTGIQAQAAVQVAERLGQLEQAWLARRALDAVQGGEDDTTALLQAVMGPTKALGPGQDR